MLESSSIQQAMTHGRTLANGAIHAQRLNQNQKDQYNSLPILVAEGDSWFDFPGDDIVSKLQNEYSYDVYSVAHRGDTLEAIAYSPHQADKFNSVCAKIARGGNVPKAFILSAGGNDVVGEQLLMILNHASSGLPSLNADIVRGLIEQRLSHGMAALLTRMTAVSQYHFKKIIPIFFHGYSHPVPDGRGFAGGFWFLPGPWLAPSFRIKGYELESSRLVIAELIDIFNRMLWMITKQSMFSHVHFVDVRPYLSNVLNQGIYKQSWVDELHPTDEKFSTIAGVFHKRISSEVSK